MRRRSVRPVPAALVWSLLIVAPARAADAPPVKPAAPPKPAVPAVPAKPAATAPAAANTAARTIALPGGRGLALDVPADWGYAARSPRPGLPPTVSFGTGGAAATDRKFSVQLTVMPMPDKERIAPDKLREVAKGRGEAMLSGSVETAVELVEVKGTGVAGWSFTMTDKAPEPGAFENLTAVFANAGGDVMLAATILHHAKDSPERRRAMDMLRSARALPAPAAGAGGGLRVQAPVGGWTITVPGAGLQVMQQGYDPSRKVAQVMAADPGTGLVVSVFMEPAQKPGAKAAQVREVYWGRAKASPIEKADVKLGTAANGDLATVSYTVPDAGQRNLNVYGARDGAWFDVHVSKTPFEPADQAALDKLLAGITFDPAPKR